MDGSCWVALVAARGHGRLLEGEGPLQGRNPFSMEFGSAGAPHTNNIGGRLWAPWGCSLQWGGSPLSSVLPRSPQTALQDQTPPAAGAARGAALCSPPGPRPHTPHSAGQPLTEPTAPHHLGTPRLPPPALDPHHPQPPPGAGAAPEGPFVQVRH